MSVVSLNLPTVFPDGVRPAEIACSPETGTILSINQGAGGPTDGPLLFPGFVDIHVHAREYPRPAENDVEGLKKWQATCQKETFSSAGKAALNGGITLYCAMPNDPVPPATEEAYARKQEIASLSPCPTILYAAVTPHSGPWADLPYKVYLDPSPSPVSFTAWSELETTLVRFRGCRMFFHAEDPELLAATVRTGPRWWTRPPEAEVFAVARILELTTKFNLRTHICHVSTRRAAGLIEEYNRTAHQKVTCEVTPHHLFFSVQDGAIKAGGTEGVREAWLLDCNPPLRSEDDRLFLLNALKNGLVDVLASDHAPHTIEDKRNGAPGMPHLDTNGAFAGWLINTCGFSPARIAQVLSHKPAGLFQTGVDHTYNSLEVGATASFTILDLNRTTEIEGTEMKDRGTLGTRCGWSPFAGIPLPGSVRAVVVRGIEHRFE